ncbi:MAG: hypothetical protein K5912_02485, partial [Alphaproteobacteria bacterium]|nr:hypothetical protein [Alphaproteobacteria bacterium]
QALLALTLVFAFIPFFARRLASRDMGAQMYVTTRQVESAKTAARIYVQENAASLPYEVTILSGNKFSDVLEPYGLPLGFVPRTALGQDISLIINKNSEEIFATIRLSGGNLSGIQRAELARRIGFYAVYDSGDPNGNIDVGVRLMDMYSDVVRRNEKNSENSVFLTDLDMGGFTLDNVSDAFTRNAVFDTGEVVTLSVNGTEMGRKDKNNIVNLNADKTVFQNKNGETALSIARGELKVGTLVAKTVSKFGDAGAVTVGDAGVDTFDMSEGRTGFNGPDKWIVNGDVVTSRISFSVERLDINSFLNATRGQDVYVDSETLSYSSASGIDTRNIYSSNITLRDQTSGGLMHGASGATVLDIRPAGTSILPDVLIDEINNGSFSIIENPTKDNGKTVTCKSIIEKLGYTYNQKSLSQQIVCQYVFWQRLERRIDVKQCLINGGSNCD